MAKPKKTFRVRDFVNYCNDLLASGMPQEGKRSIASACEHVLMRANAYSGFQCLYWLYGDGDNNARNILCHDGTGCSQWKRDQEKAGPGEHIAPTQEQITGPPTDDPEAYHNRGEYSRTYYYQERS